MNKKQLLAMPVTIAFLVVITMLQQNSLQAYLYPPPPPGSDYNHWIAGWDQAEVDAYYDAGNENTKTTYQVQTVKDILRLTVMDTLQDIKTM